MQNILFYLSSFYFLLPGENTVTLEGGSTDMEGIFIRGGGRGMAGEQEEEEEARGCKVIVWAWTMPLC